MLQITAMARRLKLRQDLGLIVVDYIQLVDAEDPRDSRQEQIAKISRRLKTLARELHVPVIALSQLNRAVESREDRRPRMADLRESGAIEQDADMVLLLHRPEYYDPTDQPGIAEIIVAKNRNGPTGSLKLTFLKNLTRFENLSQIAEPRSTPERPTDSAAHAASALRDHSLSPRPIRTSAAARRGPGFAGREPGGPRLLLHEEKRPECPADHVRVVDHPSLGKIEQSRRVIDLGQLRHVQPTQAAAWIASRPIPRRRAHLLGLVQPPQMPPLPVRPIEQEHAGSHGLQGEDREHLSLSTEREEVPSSARAGPPWVD